MADYATIAELKTQLDKTLVKDDNMLGAVITAASRAIDRHCNRPDGFVALVTATARYYPGSGKPYQWIDECTSVTAVAVKDSPSDDEDAYTAWTVGIVGTTTSADVFPASGYPNCPNYTDTPYNLLIIGANNSHSSTFTSGKFVTRGGFRPSTEIPHGLPTVKVTAKWGYATTVPAQIKEACIMQAMRWYKRIQGGMADSLASSDLGQMMYTKELDPEIGFILDRGRFVRPALVGRR